jgi:hypothetical protein
VIGGDFGDDIGRRVGTDPAAGDGDGLHGIRTYSLSAKASSLMLKKT